MQIAEALVNRGDVVVDVGAHSGLWTARMLSLVGRRGRVYAFEPLPEYANRLTMIGRAFPRRLLVHSAGASDVSGSAVLHVPTVNAERILGIASLERRGDEAESTSTADLSVPTVTLDEVLAGAGRVDLIKCDVEGHEDRVFDGATALLRKHRPAVLVELEARHRSQSLDNAFARFAELGFVGFGIYPDGLRPVAQFDLERDQLRSSPPDAAGSMPSGYINDFLFIDANTRLLRLLSPWLLARSVQ